MNISKERVAQIEAFNKYAKFISNNFGVTVLLDGMQACTDGKVISLPNIESMDSKEIDFLYGILLHEVGHVKYSDFSKEAFSKLISSEHAHLANAIEDARIEKKLLNEFDGAQDIFHKLYNVYTIDKQLMDKVFQCKLSSCSEWHALGVYIHSKILNLPNSVPLEKMVGKKTASIINKLVQENKIDHLIDSPLNNWDDVVCLTNKIYKIYFKDRKDLSEKIIIKQQEKTIDDVLEKNLKSLKDFSKELSEKISLLNKQIKKNKEVISKEKESKKESVESIRADIDKLEKKQELLEKLVDLEYEKEKKESKLQIQEKKIDILKNKIENLLKKQEKMQRKQQQDSATDCESEEKNNLISNKIKENQDKLQEQEKKKQTLFTEKEQVVELLLKTPDSLKSLSLDEKNKEINSLEENIQSLYDKISQITNPTDLESKNAILQSQVEQLKEELSKNTVESLQTIQKKLTEKGLITGILPQFIENDGWEEADVVQQMFDEDASRHSGELVVNGVSACAKSTRDILTLIDKAENEIKEIDLAEHFKIENKISKFDSFNDVLSEMKYSSTKDTVTFSSNRKHVPFTTKFDIIKTQNKIKDLKEFNKLKAQNSEYIFKIKRIFKTKLKYSKKDFFKGNKDEGSIDSRSIWKLATKVDENYFEVNNPKKINKIAASIAIDISGSMDQEVSTINKIKELALILSEGLNECFIRHEICGFHAPINPKLRELPKSGSFNRKSNNLETVIFKLFKDRNNYGIGNIELNCSDNSDGESIRLIAKRLMRENAKRKVLFIITDGKPFLSDADVSVLDQDLKNTLNWLNNNKIEVFAFGFNDQGKDFYGEKYWKVSSKNDIIDFSIKKLG